jgi:hypothetical protein
MFPARRIETMEPLPAGAPALLALAPAGAARVRATDAAITPDAPAAAPRRIRARSGILPRMRRFGPSGTAPRLLLAVKLTGQVPSRITSGNNSAWTFPPTR